MDLPVQIPYPKWDCELYQGTYIKRLNKTAILLIYDPSLSAQIRLASFRLWFTSTIKNFQIRIGMQGIDSRY